MITEFLQWMGFGLCHQLPERSFVAGGVQVPVCARDTGIYVGFVVAFAVLALVHSGERPKGFPRPYVWAVMGVLLALLAWDGVTSYAALRETTNAVRLFTGLGTGFSAAVLVYPMIQDVLWRRASNTRVLDPSWRFGVWAGAIPLTFAAMWFLGPSLGVGYPLSVALSIVFTLSAINLVIVGMLPAFDRRAETLVDVVAPSVLAVVLAFVEIALAGWIRTVLEGFSRGL